MTSREERYSKSNKLQVSGWHRWEALAKFVEAAATSCKESQLKMKVERIAAVLAHNLLNQQKRI